jgi:homoserine kinase
MLSVDEKTAKATEKVMKEVYEKIGVDYYTYVTTINNKGVEII